MPEPDFRVQRPNAAVSRFRTTILAMIVSALGVCVLVDPNEQRPALNAWICAAVAVAIVVFGFARRRHETAKRSASNDPRASGPEKPGIRRREAAGG